MAGAVLETSSSDTRTDQARFDAFRELVDRRLEASYRLANAILREPANAQDAVHDAFVVAWRKWPALRDPAAFDRWFRQIVVNTCRNRLKRDSRLRVTDISDELGVTTPDAYTVTHDRDALDGALARLKPDDQVLLALRYYEDLKVDDIARVLGIRPGTVMSRLHHAMNRLRAALDASGGKEALR